MSDIRKRTIFIDDSMKDGVIRFHDWAMVITELGVMMEPMPEIGKVMDNAKDGFVNYDALEPMCRIDCIQRISLDRGLNILGEVIHGGNLVPRIGR